jgi:hypothetical protein
VLQEEIDEVESVLIFLFLETVIDNLLKGFGTYRAVGIGFELLGEFADFLIGIFTATVRFIAIVVEIVKVKVIHHRDIMFI